jgi:hypothetical protein
LQRELLGLIVLSSPGPVYLGFINAPYWMAVVWALACALWWVGAADIPRGANGQKLAPTLAVQVRCGRRHGGNFRLHTYFGKLYGILFYSSIPNRSTNLQLVPAKLTAATVQESRKSPP